jgi:entericidin B
MPKQIACSRGDDVFSFDPAACRSQGMPIARGWLPRGADLSVADFGGCRFQRPLPSTGGAAFKDLRTLTVEACTLRNKKGPNLMRKTTSLALALLALIGLAPMLGACHTTAGIGEDLSAGGHAITNSADKHTQ